MAVKKISIALDEAVAAGVSAAAAAAGTSVSAWLNATAEHALILERGLAAIQEWEDEHGAFTADELAAADALLDAMAPPVEPAAAPEAPLDAARSTVAA